jgi:alkaline phosphatase
MKNAALRNKIILLSILAAFVFDSEPLDSATGVKARNIILFIGDCMGAEHRKAASWITAGETGKLAMD